MAPPVAVQPELAGTATASIRSASKPSDPRSTVRFPVGTDRIPVDTAGWDAYCAVNELYGDVIARTYRTGDLIWVHDYHLMLVPALLRRRIPQARIGFFLHIPFPASEVFRLLPWRREILRGLIGADLLGFHTFGYLRHFVTSLLHLEGVETDIDCGGGICTTKCADSQKCVTDNDCISNVCEVIEGLKVCVGPE